MAATDENVLVVRRSLFDELGSFHGLNFEPDKYLSALLSRGNNFFLPRAQAENDPTDPVENSLVYIAAAATLKVVF